MSTGGWIVMCLSVGVATILFVGCIVKVLTEKEEDAEHVTRIDQVAPSDEVSDSDEPEGGA